MRAHLIAIIEYLRNFLVKTFNKDNSKLPYIITTLITGIIVVVGINAFDELTENLKSKYLVTYDSLISTTITNYRTPGLTEYFIFITNFGDTWGYVFVFIVCKIGSASLGEGV